MLALFRVREILSNLVVYFILLNYQTLDRDQVDKKRSKVCPQNVEVSFENK